MLEHRMEARFDATMAHVFHALVHALGRGRWSVPVPDAGASGLPRAGTKYAYRYRRRLYAGEVLECLRPVSVVVVERCGGPVWRLAVRQRWRLETLEAATLLRLQLSVEPNCLARLQLRHWHTHFAERAKHTCAHVRQHLPARTPDSDQGDVTAGSTGQKNGSVIIVSTNTTSISGSPIFR